MKFWDKIIDWTTNNSSDYRNEKKAYEEAIHEINIIEDLLNVFSQQDIFYEFPEIFGDLSMSLKSLNDFKKVKLKLMVHEENENEKKKIKNEIRRLDEEYEKILHYVKNQILKLVDIQDIQKHVVLLNAIILKNAHLVVFKNLYNFVKKDWTIEKIDILKDEIARRNQILISYLGNFPEKR